MLNRGSGPVIARAFHRALACVLFVAFVSLGSQIYVLVGAHGLLPARLFVDAKRAGGLPWWTWPTLFRFEASDEALTVAWITGAALAFAAMIGLAPRVCVALGAVIYLSFITVGQSFLTFQWDALLVEVTVLAVFLPRTERARWIHVMFRLVVFQLYVESGIAKLQSPLHDWTDGSAMRFYYETAPLPTPLAFYAHHLPAWWHAIESRATLVIELLVPFGVWGPRRVRLATFAALTAFQIVNAATANYGFFCPLAISLHLFLLDDADLATLWLRARHRFARPWGFVARRWPFPRQRKRASPRPRWRRVRIALVTAFVAAWVTASTVQALGLFVHGDRWLTRLDRFERIERRYRAFHIVSVYHLFASVTRARVEPEFQVLHGAHWTALAFHDKPGDPSVAPPWVAPHQPRVDFQLWFYGLSFENGAPMYVRGLLTRLCRDPHAVDSLFTTAPTETPSAVRVVFWQYHFASMEAHRDHDLWWQRERVGSTPVWACR